MKFLILYLISFSVFAGNYVKISKIGKDEIINSYTDPKSCGSNCVDISKCSNMNFCKVANEEIPDYTKPIYETKSEVESCLDELDCIDKESNKICDKDNGYFVVRLEDNSEVYCTKIIGYEKKLTGKKIIKEDPVAKVNYENEQNNLRSKRLAVDSKVKEMNFGKRLYAMVQVLNKPKGISKAVRKQLRKDLADIRDDLFDGSICDARTGIMAVTVDGTVVKQSDIDTIIGKIDAYKTCP